MVFAAAAIVGDAILNGRGWHPYLAVTLALAAMATSRMKVTIPGVSGNMSVNLPFLMLSVITPERDRIDSHRVRVHDHSDTAKRRQQTEGGPRTFQCQHDGIRLGCCGLLFHNKC